MNTNTDKEYGKLEQNAIKLSESAREVSKLCSLWLEHPAVAHSINELAASAYDRIAFGKSAEQNKAKAAAHRRAAGYWAKQELEWNGQGYNRNKLQ